MTSEDVPFVATGGPVHGRKKSRGWTVIGLIAFLLGIGATLFAQHFLPRTGWLAQIPAFNPASPSVAQPPAQGPEQARARVETLRTLSAREALLAGRLGSLEERLASVYDDARAASGYATRAESMMVIVATGRALDRGRPLEYLETQLNARFGDTRPDAVRAIVAAAAQPVTLEDLRVGLDSAAPMLVAGPAGEDWWQGIRRELSQLVIIRQGQSPSSRPADRLDRAQRRMDAGQVELALAEVERMPGAASATSWTRAAERYLSARRALLELETVALEAPRPERMRAAPPLPPAATLPDAMQPAPLPTL